MQNDEGQNMDLYIPRKCCATNRLITSKDHASVQINLGHLDERGVYTGAFTTFALCGFIRAQYKDVTKRMELIQLKIFQYLLELGDAADSAPLAEEESRGPPTIGCYVIVSICNLVSSFNLQFFYFLH